MPVIMAARLAQLARLLPSHTSKAGPSQATNSRRRLWLASLGLPSALVVPMTLLALLTGLLAARPPSSPSQPSGPAASWLSVSAFASPLPLVVLAARQPIPNEPKADALLVVSGCGNDPKSGSWRCCLACEDQPAAFWGPAGAELRGRSSQAVDKKSYNLELRATEGGSAPASLLGMPAHEDWVLYGPSLDRSLVRDALAYELARLQGRWAPRYRFVELFVLDDGSTMLDTSRHYRWECRSTAVQAYAPAQEALRHALHQPTLVEC